MKKINKKSIKGFSSTTRSWENSPSRWKEDKNKLSQEGILLIGSIVALLIFSI